MKRKYPTLDLMRLIAEWDSGKWNQMLTKAMVQEDVEKLKSTLYGIQAGMDSLVKQGLNTDKISAIFVRMQRSIEITFKKILVQKYPCMLDMPELYGVSRNVSKYDLEIDLINKRKRDDELVKFIRDSSF